MHPFIQAELAALHQQDLKRDAADPRRRSHLTEPEGRGNVPADVVIRRATPGDGPALAALSALDGVRAPLGPALVAEVGGVPRAVLPLDGGRAFGDPFQRTDELVALLELRAKQLRSEDGWVRGRRFRRGGMAGAALHRAA